MPTSILLASNHPIVRTTLRLILERESEFRIVAEAASGREAIVLAEYKHPDIALLDFPLSDMSSLAVAREISAKDHAQIIFVTAQTEQAYVSEAFKAGARGYVTAGDAPSHIVNAIREIRDGRQFLSPSLKIQATT